MTSPLTTLRGINMVQLCWMHLLATRIRRFNGRVYGGPRDGARRRS